MKQKIAAVTLVVMLASWLMFLFAPTAEAIMAGELKDVRIFGHYFSTRVRGSATSEISDTSKARFLILFIEATAPTEKVTIFAHDFMLQYFREGQDDRTSCIGVGKATKEGFFDDFVALGTTLGQEPLLRIQLAEPRFYLGLIFIIENSVGSVNLYRAGSNTSIPYNIGDRAFSVLLNTNHSDSFKISEIAKCVEGSGCKVNVNTKLVQTEKKLTIHYAPGAEAAAREISLRLMTQFKMVPTLTKMSLSTVYDIVIWVGMDSIKESSL